VLVPDGGLVEVADPDPRLLAAVGVAEHLLQLLAGVVGGGLGDAVLDGEGVDERGAGGLQEHHAAAAGVGDEVDGVDVREVLDDRAAAALGLAHGDVGGDPEIETPM
jgi:hypothetical protein